MFNPNESETQKLLNALGAEPLDDAAQWIDTYRHRWERRLDRLEGHLERQKGPPR